MRTLAALSLALLAGCTMQSSRKSAESASATQEGSPASAVASDGSRALGAADWRGYRSDSLPVGWRVEDGTTLVKDGEREDIVSRDQYGDFEFDFDWKLSPGGNAGVFYRATEEYDKIYWSGPEYQLLDDAHHPDGHDRLTAAGSAYGVYPSPAGFVHAGGEWNSSRIVVRGAHVEHWLNGHKVVDYELGSPDWKARIAPGKFHEYSHYGLAPRGHIGIQGDHAGTLWIRNARVRTF